MQTQYIPTKLEQWRRPQCYIGAEWLDYFVFLGRNRDSEALTRANFDAGLQAIGGELTADDTDETPLVLIVRENHWAVGWVEWIAIHSSATEQLRLADEILERLEDYPVVDEDLWSQYEDEEAQEVWRNCYNVRDRIAYIRDHRSHCEFRDFAEMLSSIRGNHFHGYASDILS